MEADEYIMGPATRRPKGLIPFKRHAMPGSYPHPNVLKELPGNNLRGASIEGPDEKEDASHPEPKAVEFTVPPASMSDCPEPEGKKRTSRPGLQYYCRVQ